MQSFKLYKKDKPNFLGKYQMFKATEINNYTEMMKSFENIKLLKKKYPMKKF